MSPMSELPAWLESFRPDDVLYADAYENTPPHLRALLKTAIAFAFHRWEGNDGELTTERRSRRAGFSRAERSRPADWVLAHVGADFASPARFLAALLPAVLAGVHRIVVISPAPFAPAVATALELSGLEDSFVLNDAQTADVYEDLRAASPDGRVILFPAASGASSAGEKDLMHRAAADGTPLYRDRFAPALLSLYGEKDDDAPTQPSGGEMAERLLWLHPDARLLSEPAPGLDAVYLPEERLTSPHLAPFAAGPGMEACWPGPSPEFFRTRTLAAFLVQENQS